MSTSIEKARNRLASLIDVDASAVAATRKDKTYDAGLDTEKYTQWRLSAWTIIRSLAAGSHYEREFQAATTIRTYPSYYALTIQLGVLKALLADFDNGHLSNLRGLIRA